MSRFLRGIFAISLLGIHVESFGCSLRVASIRDEISGRNKYAVEISSSENGKCTAANVLDFYEDQLRQKGEGTLEISTLKEAIGKYFRDPSRSNWSAIVDSEDGYEPRRIKFTSFNLKRCTTQTPENCPYKATPDSSPPPASEDTDDTKQRFQEIFGVKFDLDLPDGPMEIDITNMPSNNFFDNPTVAEAITAGYGAVQFLGGGRALGSDVGGSFKTLLHAGQSIKEASIPAQRAYLQRSLMEALALQNIVNQMTSNIIESRDELKYLHDIQQTALSKSLEEARAQVSRLDRQAGTLQDAGPKTSQLSQKILSEALSKIKGSEAELKDIDAGKLSPSSTRTISATLANEIARFGQNTNLDYLKAIKQAIEGEKNPLRKKQYENILSQYLTQDGVVRNWAGLYHGSLNFNSSASSALGKSIRDTVNDALGTYLLGSTENVAIAGKQALDILLSADSLAANADPYGATVANRMLSRAKTILDYQNTPGKVADYQQYKLSNQAGTAFGISVSTRTADGYEIIKIANRLAAEPGVMNDPLNYMVASSAIQSAAEAADNPGLSTYFQAAINNAWAVYDVAKGVTKALWQFGSDVVTGQLQTLCEALCIETMGEVNPKPTAAAVNALLNYKKTLAAMVLAIDRVIEEFPSYSTEQKAEVVTHVALQIGGVFLTKKIFGAAEDIGRYGTAITNLLKVTRLVPGENLTFNELLSLRRVVKAGENLGMTAGDFKAIGDRFGKSSILALADQGVQSSASLWAKTTDGLPGLFVNLKRSVDDLEAIENACGLTAGSLSRLLKSETAEVGEGLKSLTDLAKKAKSEGSILEMGSKTGYWLEGNSSGGVFLLEENGKFIGLSSLSREGFHEATVVQTLANRFPTNAVGELYQTAKKLDIEAADETLALAADAAVQSGRGLENFNSRPQPILEKGSSPKGKPEIPDPKDPGPITRQNEAGNLLAHEGYDLTYRKNDGIPGSKQPDFVINGQLYDCYSPKSDKPYNIWSTARDKIASGQAPNLVINLDDSAVSLGALKKQFVEWPIEGLKYIFVIKNGKYEFWVPY